MGFMIFYFQFKIKFNVYNQLVIHEKKNPWKKIFFFSSAHLTLFLKKVKPIRSFESDQTRFHIFSFVVHAHADVCTYQAWKTRKIDEKKKEEIKNEECVRWV